VDPVVGTIKGGVFFSETRKHAKELRPLELPCGRCIGCKIDRERDWSVRLMHEASLHELSCFLTLTYKEESLPVRGNLEYDDFQAFMKRLRARCFFRVHDRSAKGRRVYWPLRFFACGEYGETTNRCHFHALIFGYNFPDRTLLPGKSDLFRSDLLDDLWGKGHCSIGSVSLESARYVSHYVVKKVVGPSSYDHYRSVDEFGEFERTPELAHMSLKPAIGKRWFERYWRDIYPCDFVVLEGRKLPVPAYYDRLLKDANPSLYDDVVAARLEKANANAFDNTTERLEVRAGVARARINNLKRSVL